MKLKALAAVVMIAAAGTSNASSDILLLSALNQSTNKSTVFEVGTINFASLDSATQGTQSWSLGNWSSFYTNGDNVVFNVTLVGPNEVAGEFFSTVNTFGGATPFFSAAPAAQAGQKYDQYLQSTTPGVIYDSNGGGAYHASAAWGPNFGGQITALNNEVGLDVAHTLWGKGLFNNNPALFNFSTDSGYTVELSSTGDFTLTNTVVPVPAAAWLFGSALVGLIGVARRRA